MKKLLMLVIVFTIILGTIYIIDTEEIKKNTLADNKQETIDNSEASKLEQLDIKVPKKINAVYGNTSRTLDEIIDKCELVVVGKLEKTELYSEFTNVNYVKVEEVILGEAENVIEISTLIGEEFFEIDKEYVLMLNVQNGYENVYYITGGNQGVIEFDKNEIKFLSSLISDDYRTSKNNERQILNSDKDEKGVFVDIIKQKVKNKKK